MRIGVLAVQGAYAAHVARLRQLGAEACLVRHADELEGLDGLILPGGESTTMLRFLDNNGWLQRLHDFVATHPTLGTCAGLILLAKEVTPRQSGLHVLDVSVQRNGYGRQLDSAVVKGPFTPAPEAVASPLEMVFIRAPRITRVGDSVEILATRDGEAVLVRQGHLLGCAFHPELSQDSRVHQLLLDMVEARCALDSI